MINTSTGMIWDWSPFGHWEPMITKQLAIKPASNLRFKEKQFT